VASLHVLATLVKRRLFRERRGLDLLVPDHHFDAPIARAECRGGGREWGASMNDIDWLVAPAKLGEILARTREVGFELASEERTGALLRVLAASKPGGRLLELGTGTGVGMAWLLDGMDRDARLITVDRNAELQAIPRAVFAGDPRLEIVTEDGLAFLRRQPARSFDLIFADAIAGKYEGLGETLRLVRRGGLLVVDDLIARKNWPEDLALKVPALIAELASAREFHAVGLAWASGLMLLARSAG
jgi:predicted O-methyltransferase YrrM